MNSFVLPPRIRVSVCSLTESCSIGNVSDYWLLFYEVVLCPCRHLCGGRLSFMGTVCASYAAIGGRWMSPSILLLSKTVPFVSKA